MNKRTDAGRHLSFTYFDILSKYVIKLPLQQLRTEHGEGQQHDAADRAREGGRAHPHSAIGKRVKLR